MADEVQGENREAEPRMTAVEARAQIAKLQEFLRANRAERMQEANAELEALLDRHGVALQITLAFLEDLQGRAQR